MCLPRPQPGTAQTVHELSCFFSRLCSFYQICPAQCNLNLRFLRTKLLGHSPTRLVSVSCHEEPAAGLPKKNARISPAIEGCLERSRRVVGPRDARLDTRLRSSRRPSVRHGARRIHRVPFVIPSEVEEPLDSFLPSLNCE